MFAINKILLIITLIVAFPSLSNAQDFLNRWEKEGGTVMPLNQDGEYKKQEKHKVKRDITERLEEIKTLKEKGLITEEDYNRKKQEILDDF